MNFTHQNHLKYSIGGREYGYRETPTEKFVVSLGSVDLDQYRTSSFSNEMYRAAELVHEDLGNDLVLFLSGGTDSELVLRSFVHNGFKPQCAVVKFENDYNASEVKEAKIVAEALDVKLEILDFNVKEFYYSGEAKEFGESVQGTQITYLTIFKNILKLGAPAVMGGEAGLTRHINKTDSFWYYAFRENEDGSAMRFSNKFNIPLVNEWFSYTPEMLLYYLECEGVKNLVTEKFNYKLTAASSKNKILKELFDEFRQKFKRHGFEKLIAFNSIAYAGIGADQVPRLESSLDGIPYDIAVKQLKGTVE
jgi:hypothetical protein